MVNITNRHIGWVIIIMIVMIAPTFVMLGHPILDAQGHWTGLGTIVAIEFVVLCIVMLIALGSFVANSLTGNKRVLIRIPLPWGQSDQIKNETRELMRSFERMEPSGRTFQELYYELRRRGAFKK